jgi:hypothetical protein
MPYLTDAEMSVSAEVRWCEFVDMEANSAATSWDCGVSAEGGRRECGQERVEWVSRFM